MPSAILITNLTGPAEDSVAVNVSRQILQKRRWRATATDGTALAVDFATPVTDGATLESGGRRFRIRQIPEKVVVIPLPANPSMASKIGWYLGNRHIPIEVREDEMLVELFPTLTDSLDRIGITYLQRTDVLRVRAHSSAHRH